MMSGHHGLRGTIQAVNPDICVDHCIIHRYSLGSISLSGSLKLGFEDVLNIVNFIESRDVNSRIFKELCKKMGEEFQVGCHEARLYVESLSSGRLFNNSWNRKDFILLLGSLIRSGLLNFVTWLTYLRS